MNKSIKSNDENSSLQEKIFNELKDKLIDPLAIDLSNNLQWINLDGISNNSAELYPVAVLGNGPPILLLHGFDSSFLEFRRLAPLLSSSHRLIIPDLYGFGFCPRPSDGSFGLEGLVKHINQILFKFSNQLPIGVIGASMGGALAMEVARRYPTYINRLLLLSPAGLTGKPRPIPRPLDQLGVCFLSQKLVRKQICKQAFANPIKSVGAAEEQIASLHLNAPGWRRSLAEFARSGGLANCGSPLPTQRINVLWGANDRILTGIQKKESFSLLGDRIEEIQDCGHLPHLDKPKTVAMKWEKEVIR